MIGASQTDRSEAFVRSAGFAPWATVIAAQTAFWLLVAGPLWSDVASAWRRARIGRSATAALAGALILILVVFPMLSQAREIPWPLWGHQAKVRMLTVLGGLLVGVPAVSGIALVQQRVRRRETEPIDTDDVRFEVEARSEILRYLFVAGAVIGLAVLSAGALREATVPTFVGEDRFPEEGVLLYGAFFTGLSPGLRPGASRAETPRRQGPRSLLPASRGCPIRIQIRSRDGWTNAPRWRPCCS